MKRIAAWPLAGLVLAGCAIRPLDPSSAPARIDHVIIGVADLEKGIGQLERLTGVRAASGGSHPGRGTRNALMSLGGGTYLELYAPDPAQSVRSKDVEELQALRSLKPLGWAISANDATLLRATVERAGVAISATEAGSRKRPDGSVLHWQTFDFANVTDPTAPFFILWDEPRLHPSVTSPGGCRLTRIDVRTPWAHRYSPAIARLGLPAVVTAADFPALAVTLLCPRGKVVLR